MPAGLSPVYTRDKGDYQGSFRPPVPGWVTTPHDHDQAEQEGRSSPGLGAPSDTWLAPDELEPDRLRIRLACFSRDPRPITIPGAKRYKERALAALQRSELACQ